MMYQRVQQIHSATPELTDGERVIVRLLRGYVACGETQQRCLPSLIALGSNLGIGAFVAIALASVFQLTESCLRRKLITMCCCSEDLSSDERAILQLMETETVGAAFSVSPIPDGLSGALLASRRSAAYLASRI